jgi:hypothetical protein
LQRIPAPGIATGLPLAVSAKVVSVSRRRCNAP